MAITPKKYPNLVHVQKGQVLNGIPRARPEPEKYSPPPFTQAETFRWWQFTKTDYWYQNQMRISRSALGAVLGLTVDGMSNALDRKISPDNILGRIAGLIPSIESRALVFPWQKRGPSRGGVTQMPLFLWLDPPKIPRRVSALCLEDAWDLFARCKGCSENKWLPLSAGGKNHIACYHCLPPSQWKSFGGEKGTRRLIAEACRKLV